MKNLFAKLKEKVSPSRLKDGLARTRQQLADNVHQVLTGRARIDEEALEDLEEVLITGDVGVGATEAILDRLRVRIREENIETGEALEAALIEEITLILKRAQPEDVASESEGPHVILLIGVNGAGKTTTLGKLAHLFRSADNTVLVAAGDTFRAAAVDQLRVWAERAGVDIVANDTGADPASVAFDAVAAAQARNIDVLLIDTAGRLQTKVNLMEELRKIGRVVDKRMPGAPHEVLLVLDATTGQNAVQQARQFGEVMPISGIVLTKVDGTAKGGVVVAIAEELGLPVRYLGLGEGMDDLTPFDAESFASALFQSS